MEPWRTSESRAPTDLDRGARLVLLQKVAQDGGPRDVGEWLRTYFDGRFADPADYIDAIETAHGRATAAAARQAMQVAQVARKNTAQALMLAMPDGDFLELLERGMAAANTFGDLPNWWTVEGVNDICKGRGIPFQHNGVRFTWTGEPEVEHEATTPAASFLTDSRLEGARSEFETARAELTKNTETSRKQSVAEACNAVESAMKVLAAEGDVPLDDKRQGASTLFQALADANVVDRNVENVVTGAARVGNRLGRHGAGATPHTVSEEVASATVAAAAVAITYLAKHLP